MKRLLFIVNPKAGKTQIKNRILELSAYFRQNGYQITLHPTLDRLDARDVVREEGESYDLIVCAGGDGTLDEVVTGIQMGKITTPLGYIPAGSTNDYAKSLKIPSNPMAAAKIIMEGREHKVDLGAFGSHYFVYCAAFGAFTEVSYSTKQSKKNVLGHMAYLVDGAMSLSNIKPYEMTVDWDGHRISGEFIYGMVTNSLSVGGFRSIVSKQTELDDGLFEVLLVKNPKNPADLNRILSALVTGDPTAEGMVFIKTSAITFTSELSMPWALDGEYGGDHNTVTVINQKQCLTIMTK